MTKKENKGEVFQKKIRTFAFVFDLYGKTKRP